MAWMMCRADKAEEDAVVVVVMVLTASVSREDMIRGVMSVAVAVGYMVFVSCWVLFGFTFLV